MKKMESIRVDLVKGGGGGVDKKKGEVKEEDGGL